MTKRYVVFDCETYSAGREYGMKPHEFVRLFQWSDDRVTIHLDEIHTEADLERARDNLRNADYIIGHNIISADLTWIFGVDSMEPLEMALAGKVIDTYVLATLLTPAPHSYTTATGHTFYDAAKPGTAMKWLGLENLCFQFGLPGKFGDLSEIAKRYNPPKTPKEDLEYGLIDLKDPEFLEYSRQDIVAGTGLYDYLMEQIRIQDYNRDYLWRELVVWSINAQISKNGVVVDTETAQARVDELAKERDEIMEWLVRDFDMPTTSKMPWKSNAGKGAILKALDTYGIRPEGNDGWTRTASGAPSFSGDTMIAVTEGTEAEALGRALATLQGQRSLAQLALESTFEDGRIHPGILCLQRSGRTSVTKPGLTVWTARGPGAVEKRYMVADPGHVMVECDYSAADARAVAGVSGDIEYAKRFEPGADAHEITGRIFFGDKYDDDPKYYRNKSKPGTHGMSYRIGVKKLAWTLGVSVEEAKGFLDSYAKTYPWVTLWQNKITEFGETHGYVENSWGRRMRVDEGRSFTQSSALIGQSTTREVLYDGMIRIARDRPEVIRWFRMLVHDAIVLSVPKEDVDWGVPYVLEKMQMTFHPVDALGQDVFFPMEHGPLDAEDWFRAGH